MKISTPVDELNQKLAAVGTGVLQVRLDVWVAVRYGELLYDVYIGTLGVAPNPVLVIATDTREKAERVLAIGFEDADLVPNTSGLRCYLWALAYESDALKAHVESRLSELRASVARRMEREAREHAGEVAIAQREAREALQSVAALRKYSAAAAAKREYTAALDAALAAARTAAPKAVLPSEFIPKPYCKLCRGPIIAPGRKFEDGFRHVGCRPKKEPAQRPAPWQAQKKFREPERVVGWDEQGQPIYRHGERREADGVWICPPGWIVKPIRARRALVVVGWSHTPTGIHDKHDDPADFVGEFLEL